LTTGLSVRVSSWLRSNLTTLLATIAIALWSWSLLNWSLLLVTIVGSWGLLDRGWGSLDWSLLLVTIANWQLGPVGSELGRPGLGLAGNHS